MVKFAVFILILIIVFLGIGTKMYNNRKNSNVKRKN